MSVLLAVVLMLSLSRAASAESLTWDACLREASERNPELAAAQERLAAARERATGAYSPFLPQLSAGADWSRARSSASGGSSAARNDVSAGLSARQNLFAGWKDTASLGKARAERMAAEADLQDTSSRLRLDLASAFAQLSFGQDALRLAETILSRRQENVRLVELRFEAGRENKGSYLRSKAAGSQARFEVAQADRALGVKRRQLARILGRNDAADLVVSGDVPPLPSDPNPDFRGIAEDVPSLQRARAAVDSAGAGVESARGQLFPGVDALTSFARGGDEWPPDSNRWSAGLSMTYPFFPGGRTAYDIRSARAEERRAEATLRDTRERAVADLEAALSRYRDAVERYGVQNEFLEAARLRAEIGRSQYTSGLLSFQDWDLIENDLISTEKSWLASKTDVWLAQAEWLRAQGKGLDR
ncbi:MAG: TolC family protein [Nitrospirae bacterium]|nr:TolC family protein [Nitrospirota bacterium]